MSECVWVPHSELGFVRASVISTSGDASKVKTDTGEVLEIPSNHLTPIHSDENLAVVTNLTNIADLNSASLLQALQERFEHERIYTFTGQVLIAVNPFQRIKALYANSLLENFLKPGSSEQLDPHVYSIADASFRSMIKNRGRNQSVLVSGESGAGKTETTKIVLNYLTKISNKGGKDSSDVCKAVLQTNELLEAFGNARTVRNDNSSRFGKLIQLQFSPKKHELIGATIDTYLLEKARITHQSPGERNFHIFYELAAGCSDEEKQALLIPDLADTTFTNQSGLYTRIDTDDKDQFKKTLKAMQIVGVSKSEKRNVFKVVSAVLHLGNIEFAQTLSGESGCDFSQDKRTQKAVTSVCALLEVSEHYLRQTLCTRSISTGGKKGMISRMANGPETVFRAHNVSEAREARDALARTLYHRLFYWVVWKVNLKVGEVGQDDDIRTKLSDKLQKLSDFTANEKRNKKLKKDTPTCISDYSIGCLDIFGFEVFEHNSFEQLCINYANEVLQQQFNTFVFKDEQNFYKSEGINWKNIEFPDNMECIRMIEGTKRQIGLLKLIDEECMYPKGSDQSLHAKLQKHLAVELDIKVGSKREKGKSAISHLVTNSFSQSRKSGRFTVDQRTQKRQLKFTICHFAGDVEYNVRGFYAKNKDELRREAVGLLRGSKNSLVRILLPADAMNGPQDSSGAGKYFQEIYERAKRKRGRKRSVLMRGSLERNFNLDLKQGQKIQQITVGKQFKNQLYQAMKHIRSSQPHYVRCIKPNDVMSPEEFDRMRVLEQLNYSGVLEVVRVARAGYSSRFEHKAFIGKFKILAASDRNIKLPKRACKKVKTLQKACKDIINTTDLEQGVDFEIGNTVTMFRSEGYLKLESLRKQLLLKYVLLLQRWYRYKLFKRKMKQYKSATLLIQRVFRGYKARKEFYDFRQALIAKRAAEEQKHRQEQEARRIKEETERLKKKALEVARLKKIEEERRIAEEKRQEALRIAKEKREKELRLKKKAEAAAKLKRETEAAIVLQSFFRVLQAQAEANALYEQKLQQEFLLNEAANVIIDLFRENVRKKKLARARAAADEEEMQRLKLEKQERLRNKIVRQQRFEQRLKKKRKKQAEVISGTFDTLISLCAPLLLLFIFSNPNLLMLFLFFSLSLAAGVTFTVSARKRHNYLKRKKRRKKRSKRSSVSDESESDFTLTNKVLFVEGTPSLVAPEDIGRKHIRGSFVSELESPRFPMPTPKPLRKAKRNTQAWIKTQKTSGSSKRPNSHKFPHLGHPNRDSQRTLDIRDMTIRSHNDLTNQEVIGSPSPGKREKNRISRFFKKKKRDRAADS